MTDLAPPARAAIAAVVLNWNSWPHTRECLGHLQASSAPIDVILVDNGSTDGSATRAGEERESIAHTVRLRTNRGFTGGMNAGLVRAIAAGYEYVWLLNNDVTFAPEMPARLRARLDEDDRALVLTPALVRPGGAAQHSGGIYRLDGSGNRLLTAGSFPSAADGGVWLTGTALFCRTGTARRIGLFDDRFFAYWEDVDWSWRAQRLGIGLAVAADCVAVHHSAQGLGAGRSPLAAHLLARNELLLLRKYLTGRPRHAAMARAVARALRWAMLLDRRGQPETQRAWLGGIAAGLAGLRGRPRLLALQSAAAAAGLRRPLAMARWLEAWADRGDG